MHSVFGYSLNETHFFLLDFVEVFIFHKHLRSNPQSLTEVNLLPLSQSPTMSNFQKSVTKAGTIGLQMARNLYLNTSWRKSLGNWTYDMSNMSNFTSDPSHSLCIGTSYSIASRSFDPLTQNQFHNVFGYLLNETHLFVLDFYGISIFHEFCKVQLCETFEKL